MRPARSMLALGVLFLVILLGLSATPARADGSLLVSPASGSIGTTFQIQGSGFAAGETVSLWMQYPDGRQLKRDSATADSSGSVTFQLATDAGFSSGGYLVLAHGESSGANLFGRFSIGGAGTGSFITGTAVCQGSNFIVTGFIPGESVAVFATAPNGSTGALGMTAADGSGATSFTLPVQPGMATGAYVISEQGLLSGHQTSDTLVYDGATISGSHCSIAVGGGPGGINPSALLRNIVEYRGPGVYLGTDPTSLYYFDCNWKWRPMGGVVYMLIVGFRPYETIDVSYEILAVQGRTHYSTISSDGSGNAVFGVNTYSMPLGHYHWWFTSPSASYCGHYDAAVPY